jgi:hypothetical protein
MPQPRHVPVDFKLEHHLILAVRTWLFGANIMWPPKNENGALQRFRAQKEQDRMTKTGIISATILAVCLGPFSAAIAQHDEHGNDRDKSKPAEQTHPRQNARPQQTYGGVYHGGVQYDGPTHGGVHHSGVPQHEGQVRAGFAQSRAGAWKTEHQTWSQRGGYTGYRIPENRFRLYFGREHFFRIHGLPMVFVGGQPRFQYDGYWVTFMDTWPEDWAPDWYQTDDVYLDYNGDGYYLYNRLHPGFPIAVTITF